MNASEIAAASPHIEQAGARPEVRTPWERIGHFLRELWRLAFVWVGMGVSPGIALWCAFHVPALPALARNQLPTRDRLGMLAAGLASLALLSFVYVATWLVRRRREPGVTFAATVTTLQHYGFVLVALPLIARLSQTSMGGSAPFTTLVLTILTTSLIVVWAYRMGALPAWASARVPIRALAQPWPARVLLALSVVGYAWFISALSVLDHHNLDTDITDLGIYDNVVWNTLHGKFLACPMIRGGSHVSAHFDPILWVVAQFYRVSQRAETLLVLQATWLATGAIPLFLSARRTLRNEWLAAGLATLYLLHPALQGANLYDFHSLSLLQPFALWLVYFLDTGAHVRYWLVLPFLLACREDVSLLVSFVGVYAILGGRVKQGLATVLACGAYFASVKLFAMNDSDVFMAGDNTYSYAHFFAEMIPNGEGAGGIVMSLLTNPSFVVQLLLKPEKVQFFAILLLPLLCLPLFARDKKALLLYGFVFLGIASRVPVFSIHFQYSSVLLPMLFVALPESLVRVNESARLERLGLDRGRLVSALCAGMVAATLIISAQYGAVVPNGAFRGGWTPIVRHPTPEMLERFRVVERWRDAIPPEASVGATRSIVPHVSNRAHVFEFPNSKEPVDYLLLHPSRARANSRAQIDAVRRNKDYRLLERKLGLELYERVNPPVKPALRLKPGAATAPEARAPRSNGALAPTTPSVPPTDAVRAPATMLRALAPGGAPKAPAPTASPLGAPKAVAPTASPLGAPKALAPAASPLGAPKALAPAASPTGAPKALAPTRGPAASAPDTP